MKKSLQIVLILTLITPNIVFAVTAKDVAKSEEKVEKAENEYYQLIEKHRGEKAFIVGNSHFSGVFETKDSNGVIKSQVTYLNGKLNGKAIWWRDFNKGFKEVERSYKDGLIDGVSIEWRDENEKESETSYKNGKKDGLEVYYLKGYKHSETNWKNGKKDGLLIYYHEDGSKSSQTNYKNGKKDGISYSWYEYPEGVNKIDVSRYKNGVEVGDSESYYADKMSEIKDRCLTQMEEHGYALVKACVDQDLDALGYVDEHLKSHKAIAERCSKTMKEHGYALIKACIQQDISAKEILDKY